jgi:hypothetical protein
MNRHANATFVPMISTGRRFNAFRESSTKQAHMSYFARHAFLVTSALLIAAAAPASAEKINVGEHLGDATIVSIAAVDSDRAWVSFRRELDDSMEYCARNLALGEEGGADQNKVNQCAKDEQNSENGKTYERSAICSKKTVETEFGDFSLVKWEKEEPITYDGKKHRPIRTDWKNKNGEIVGNCSACNTSQIIDTFRVLCPASYRKLFDGYEPY